MFSESGGWARGFAATPCMCSMPAVCRRSTGWQGWTTTKVRGQGHRGRGHFRFNSCWCDYNQTTEQDYESHGQGERGEEKLLEEAILFLPDFPVLLVVPRN